MGHEIYLFLTKSFTKEFCHLNDIGYQLLECHRFKRNVRMV